MKKKVFSIFKVLIISTLASKTCFAQNWKPLSANITFKIKHIAGATAEGSFKGFSGSINFDAQNLSASVIKATVETKTFETGSSLRDKTMKGSEYLDVEKYPKITMSLTKVERSIEPNTYIGYFDLTIKNITKSIKIPFTFVQNNNQGQFKTSFTINRRDYGVGGKSFILNDFPTIFIVVNVEK